MNTFACRPGLFLTLSFLCLLAALPWQSLRAQEPIGRVVVMAGRVDAVSPAGARRTLARASEIHPGDLVITGPRGRAQVRMVDGALLSLRPGTEFEFSDFSYDGPGGAGDSAVMSLIRGGFRTMSGTIGEGQGDEYRVVTEHASIGIRGTTHEALIDPQSNALYTGVMDGGTTVSNAQGALDLGLGADFDFSETLPGQAPRGLLSLPLVVTRYDFAALVAAASDANPDPTVETVAETAASDSPREAESNGPASAGNALGLAAAPATNQAAGPSAASSTPPSPAPTAGVTPAVASGARPDSGAREPDEPLAAPPVIAAAPSPADGAPPNSPSNGTRPPVEAAPAQPLVAGRESTPREPAGSRPPSPRSEDRGRGLGLTDLIAGLDGPERGAASGDLPSGNGRAHNGQAGNALSRLLDSVQEALTPDRGASPRAEEAPRVPPGRDIADARGKSAPNPVAAENTGDDTEATINPAQNLGGLLAQVLDRIAGGRDKDGGKGRGQDKTDEKEEDEDERPDQSKPGNGLGRGLASRGDDDDDDARGRGRGRGVARALQVAQDQPVLVAPPGRGGAGVLLLREAPETEGLRPHPDFEFNWGFWNAERPLISPHDASGALTPLPELAYWARVLPADMAELRALSARWRFASGAGGGQFLGSGSAGELTALDMGFDVDLASGRISGGSFHAVAGQESWDFGFSGQVNGNGAVMHDFAETTVHDASGLASTGIDGKVEGVFTGTGTRAGFVTGFALDGGGRHLQGLGLLEGRPE